MFHLLGFLFIIIIAVFVIGLSIAGSVLRAIFGFGRRRPAPDSSRSYTNNTHTQQQRTSSRQEDTTAQEKDANSKNKKIFAKDEGEYVDFEEIK